MSWLGDKCIYPSPEVKGANGQVEWTQEGGLTLFQYTVIQLAAQAMGHFAGRYEDEGFADLVVTQARALIERMETEEADIRGEE